MSRFLRVLWGGLGHDFALHPGSPVLLGTLSCFSRALLASILGVLVPKAVSKVSLVGFGEPLRNMRLHVRIAHRAPSPVAQK